MKVFVVEDNPVYCKYVCNLLAKEGFETETASSLSAARKLADKMKSEDTILADLRLPDGECTGLLQWMRNQGKRQRFIVMTDYAEVHTAVESMKLGSEDYIPKRLIEERLLPLVQTIRKEQERTRRAPIFRRTSKAYLSAKHRAKIVAPTNLSVMILGENGTGKEHFAQYIHEKSKRADKPFVAVDCGSLSPALAQSAFFGHVKGAFTGADANRSGFFQEAEGGTLFLDKTADVRIIAATNEDLQKAVSEKRFRQDLLYRLQEYAVTVPPLRESSDDIMPLSEFFREQANMELERNVKGFDQSARKALLTHSWPGNVRELRLTVQAAVLHTAGDMVSAKDLEITGEHICTSCFEKERILRALEQAEGNRNMASQILGIGRTTLYRKMMEYGLKYGDK